eukprot:TRINITY_DN14349_c2_g1_i1.p1 TRINITY_DN14349_c2_g1~~TRINITY_DN14349_c2_g1_i1.p1  ORF type:complete len:279 (-),score=34.48 TRINITY_DN14349_c2_g1_i1:46-882(-)
MCKAQISTRETSRGSLKSVSCSFEETKECGPCETQQSDDENLKLHVSLMSGTVLIEELRCYSSETLSCIRQRIAEVCDISQPFLLLDGTTILRSRVGLPNPMKTLTAGSYLTLVKLSREDLGSRLSGRRGAAARGNLEEVYDLLDDGADVDWRDDSELRTPLMWAAANGQESIVHELLRHGANQSLRAFGCSAFTLAEANGHLALAETLRKAAEPSEEHEAVAPSQPLVRRLSDSCSILALSLMEYGAGARLQNMLGRVFRQRRSKSVVVPLPHRDEE